MSSEALDVPVFPEDFKKPVRSVELVTIGTELVAGFTVNTNASWLCAELARLGVPVRAYSTVADDLELAVDELTRAAERADLVVVTGGLGPTRDDITRDVLARAAGVELVLDEKLLADLNEFFRKRLGREMSGNNRQQAFLPEGALALSNPVGTAPGIACIIGAARVFAFPGVPRELRAMFGHVRAFLSGLPKPPGVIAVRQICCFGTGESDIGTRVADLMDPDDNPVTALTVADGIITVRLTAQAETHEAAEKLLNAHQTEVCARLGELVFTCDGLSLQEAVARALIENELTIAVAESCTGGGVAHALTDVPGISAALIEAVVAYSNASKVRRLGVSEEMIERHGAVSAEVAAAMAEGIREPTDADVGLGITGIAGPTGGTSEKPIGLVYIAVADSRGTEVKKLQLHGNRSMVRTRAVMWALNMVRLLINDAAAQGLR